MILFGDHLLAIQRLPMEVSKPITETPCPRVALSNAPRTRYEAVGRFVHPEYRPGRLDAMPSAGAGLACLCLALAIIAFQFSDESWWYALVGGVLLVGSLVLGWRNRASLRSAFRPGPADDLRKLYHHHSA
jgi:hypothetical protein